MAAKSDGAAADMVSGADQHDDPLDDHHDDQPIDLSQTPRKPRRVMPPLIPIKLLRAGYTPQQASRIAAKTSEITLSSLIKGKAGGEGGRDGDDVERRMGRREGMGGEMGEARGEKDYGDGEEEVDEEDDVEVRRKRVRLENGDGSEEVGEEAGGEADHWLALRLDRARSVPQLTPLPLPLQRSKSLSESRIPTAAAAAAAASEGGGPVPSQPQLHEHLRRQLQATGLPLAPPAAHATHAAHAAAAPDSYGDSWVYVGYYSQLLHRFQAQELLRQLALQHQHRDAAHDDQKTDGALALKTSVPTQEEEAMDSRRRQARPLTGKHVRPGTGASPATLLTLRRKIQARQQQLDSKRLLE